MTAAWTHRPRRVFQHLLRERDAIDLNPAELVAEAVAMRADTYLCMGGGFSAWYPTEIEGHVRNPYLEGDLVGRVVEVARAHGLRVLFRIDISKDRPGSEAAAPDLYCRTAEGRIATVWGMPQTCPTGPVWEDRNFAILAEALSRCEVDGVFYNYFTVPSCHCARCTAAVMAEIGAPPPATGRTPAHDAWRAARLARYARRLQAAIRAVRPAACLIPYHHVHAGWDRRAMAEVSDIVAFQISNPLIANPVDPQPVWSLWPVEEVHLARALKPGAAPIAVQSGSGFFASRQTALSGWRLARNLLLAASCGGGTAIAVNGRLAEAADPRLSAPLERIADHLTRNRSWYEGLTSMARIAVLRSEASVAWGSDLARLAGGAEGGHVHEFRGTCEMLSALRRPFDILPADGVRLPELRRYAVVVAPGLSCLAEHDVETLDAFVAGGGSLVATGAFAAARADGRSRAAPASTALNALPGPARPLDGGYFEIAEPELRQALSGASHIGATGLFHDVAAGPDWDRALALVEPVENNAPEFTVVAAPGYASGWLGRSLGEGRAEWLPWYPGTLFHRAGFADLLPLFDRLVRFAGAPPIRSTAPAAVDFTLYRHPEGAVLHVFNGAAHHGRPVTEAVPIAGFDIEIDLPGAEAQSLCGTNGTVVEATETGLRLGLPRLDGFAAFALTNGDQETKNTNARQGRMMEGHVRRKIPRA